MTVSVVGTVFLVNADEDGSRVAVIEGEVRVQEGQHGDEAASREQVSTNRAVAARPGGRRNRLESAGGRVSRNPRDLCQGHGADGGSPRAFEQCVRFRDGGARSGRPVAQGQPTAPPQFEEASIRTCDPDNIPAPPPGARGGGANSFQMTPGRTHALCLTLATIIRHAYGYGPVDVEFLNPGGRGRGMNVNTVYGLGVEDGRRVRGGPDWVRSERYTIDAVADGAADAATMSGPMLRESARAALSS